MRHVPPKSTIDDVPRPVTPAPNDIKSSAPAVIVQCWCALVRRMDRPALDRFTRDIWARFDERDLAALKSAILDRRAELQRAGRSPR
ncbi:MAG TPA: hypothetical protein VM076_09630 [Gemmatimonadaceae bacterium]|nr:hypothetical protein [Gemmatimonadaceae bacterium]